jgi:hypothetical protein
VKIDEKKRKNGCIYTQQSSGWVKSIKLFSVSNRSFMDEEQMAVIP